MRIVITFCLLVCANLLYSQLDTLAQKRTEVSTKQNSDSVEIIYGTGAWKDSIKKRPKRKFITQTIALAFIDVAKEKNETEWIKRYWNVWHCQNKMTTHNGRGYSSYCKNRCCSICVSIRKADLINRYKPIIETWTDIQFLTLTVKSQPHSNLNNWMGGMIKAFKIIRERCNKRHSRNKGPKLIGVRSLECNFNPIKKTYNPHYNILCATKEIAETIKKEWVELWNRDKIMALPYLQKIRKVKQTEKDIIETIKYGAKIFTDPTMKKGKTKTNPTIYAKALHTIYKSMEGHRLFGSFGFKLPKTEKSKNGRVVKDFQNWFYNSKLRDWVNIETGQIMTNYIPKLGLEMILNSIDLDSN